MFENGASFVVASFDAAAGEAEGDLTGYMNELARLNSVPGSWQLCKSTANWGQVQVQPLSHSIIPFCPILLTFAPLCFASALPKQQPHSSVLGLLAAAAQLAESNMDTVPQLQGHV